MTHSPLTNRIAITPESQPRTERIDMFILHHAATTSLAAILSLFQPGGRTVSANYAMGNDGELVLTVDEDRRAWTSASSLDNRAVTIEVANLSTEGWTISDRSHEKLAQLAADLHRRYGMPLDREHVVGHRELYSRWGESYPTACPGGMALDWIVDRARQIIANPAIPEKEDTDMPILEIVRPQGRPECYWVVDRSQRHHIATESILRDYLDFMKQKGYPAVVKEVKSIESFGVDITPKGTVRAELTEDSIARIVAAVEAGETDG